MHVRNASARRSGRLRRAGPVAALTALAASALLVPAAPSAAALARVRAVVVVGHGWGPGVGMGQWGDFGYAVRYHFDYERILAHFYGRTVPATLQGLGRPANPAVRVLVLENMNLATNVGYDPVVTSASAFTVVSATAGLPAGQGATTTTAPTTTAPTTSSTTIPTTTAPTTTAPTTTAPTTTTTATTVPVTTTTVPTTSATTTPAPTTTTPAGTAAGSLVVPAGSAVDLRLGANGTWSAYEAGSCSAARRIGPSSVPVATGLVDPVVVPASERAGAPRTDLLTICRHDGIDETVRGRVEAYNRSGFERTLNVLPLQSYLDGVVPAEESPSWGLAGESTGAPQGEPWGFQALEAQAVAARSYAVAYAAAGGWNGYADICDSTYCQAYVGVSYEYPITDRAVGATLGEVRVDRASAAVVSTRYSASSGGWTAPSEFPAVPDRGDACVVAGYPLECNPNHTWRVTIGGPAIARHFRGLGALLGVRVVARNRRGALGGRALVVLLTGTRKRVRVGGAQFAAVLGLRSDWIAVARLTRVGPRLPVPKPPVPAAPTTTVPASPPTTTPPAAPATTLPGAPTTTGAP